MLTHDDLALILEIVDQRRLLEQSGWVGWVFPLDGDTVFAVMECETSQPLWH